MTVETIAALATPPGVGGVAVIRLSGPNARLAGVALCPKLLNAPPRRLVWDELRDGEEVLDDALAVWFQAPHSFTGEDVVELHCHGGRAVVAAVLQAVLAQPQVRLAGPGEFTRRAVEHGKLDLTAAEGLADLIDAETEAQRRQALRQLGGALGERFESWRHRILALLAQVEAGLDFPDEELEILSDAKLAEGMRGLLSDWDSALQEEAGRKVREGLSLAILGAPNAGKSTLLNALAGQAVAIVSAQAGTTRDVVRQVLELGGCRVEVADTAGLRDETSDVIEREGIQRAKLAGKRADVVLWVADARTLVLKGGLFSKAVPPTLQEPPPLGLLAECRALVVLSHADLVSHDLPKNIIFEEIEYPVLALNLQEAGAARRLQTALTPLVQAQAGLAEGAAWLTRERHQQAVRGASAKVAEALRLCLRGVGNGGESLAELVAQELREAAAAIGSVTGRTTSEDVLDVVFSTFCIGK
ncbi:MAG: tRNA uridine-5-carboxymethylaminomethyl(34) synthesis GTPase MnmE [Alphaproteobacteria bacterium]|nr:tRNA uridine-5-carboxymethylaminomethyl(34) synthesis GTPase MnmE [Alphaproteobacteria bacterium]